MWERRPLVPLAAGLAAGIWGVDRVGMNILFFLVLLAMVLPIISEKEKDQHRKISGSCFPDRKGFFNLFMLFILFLWAGSLICLLDDARVRHIPAYDGEIVRARGLVTGVQSGDSYSRIEVKVEELNGKRVREKTIVGIKGDAEAQTRENLTGKEISIEGKAELPAERRNPKTFDYRNYLETQRIYGLIQDGRILSISSNPKGFSGVILHHASCWKERIKLEMSRRIPENKAAMLMGMMFGETEQMDEGILEQFRKNGTAHILAVSGLHIAMVYAAVSLLIPGGRIGKDLTILFLLFLYMVLAAFSPSVMRAFIMIGIHMSGKRLYARYDLLSSASLTFTVLLLLNPRSLFHPGFQLSFLAIFSLAFLLPILEKILNSRMMPMLLALPIGLSPFTAFLFNYVSLSGLILNPPVVFLAGVLIPAALVLLPMVLIPGTSGLLDFMGHYLQLLLETLHGLNSAFFSPGRSYKNVMSPEPFILFLYYAGLFFGVSEAGQWFFRRAEKKWKAWILMIPVLMVLIHFLLPKGPFQEADAIFVDVGQGDCIHIRTDGDKHILVDGGGHKDQDVGTDILLPYLLKNRVPGIDLAVVTHLHTDHFEGIGSLARQGMVKKIALYEGYRFREEEILSVTGMKQEDLIYVTGGMTLKPDAGTSLHILGPPARSMEEYRRNIADSEDENKNSLVLMAETGGGKILLTGDITLEGEYSLMSTHRDIRADVLKVSHHGSKSSSGEGFLEQVDPQSAVIQVGRNYYGHPSRDVLEKFEKLNIPVFRNDHHGAVALRFDTGLHKSELTIEMTGQKRYNDSGK